MAGLVFQKDQDSDACVIETILDPSAKTNCKLIHVTSTLVRTEGLAFALPTPSHATAHPISLDQTAVQQFRVDVRQDIAGTEVLA